MEHTNTMEDTHTQESTQTREDRHTHEMHINESILSKEILEDQKKNRIDMSIFCIKDFSGVWNIFA